GDIEAHGEVTRVRHLLLERLDERSVALVDVEVVVLEEIVRDVDVGPPITVHVGDDDAESESDFAAVNAGLRAHIDEMAAIVAIKLVATVRMTHIARVV